MALTVKELRDALLAYADDTLIIMSNDSDGNRFSPLGEWGIGRYIAVGDYSGDLASEEDNSDAGVPCVVLWPTN